MFYKNFRQEYISSKKNTLSYSATGIIAKININDQQYNSQLVLHEETVRNKESKYQKDLNKFNILTSPLILGHENTLEICNYYNKIMLYDYDIKFNHLNHSYYFWKLANHHLMNSYFSNIKQFFVADGHHRIAALKKLSKKAYAYAFIVPKKTLSSKNIIRHYINEQLSDNAIKSLFINLKQKYDLRTVTNTEDTTYIMFSYKNKKIKLNSQNINLIKEFLMDVYNALSKNLINFRNKAGDTLDSIPNDQFVLYISSKLGENLKSKNLIFPPHSTYFEPKFHNGIVSMDLSVT